MKFQNRRRHDSVKSCICSSLLVLVICGAFIFFLDPWNIPIKRTERVGPRKNTEQLKSETEVPDKNEENFAYIYNNTAPKMSNSSESEKDNVKSDKDEYLNILTYEKIKQAPTGDNTTVKNEWFNSKAETTTKRNEWMQGKDVTNDTMKSRDEYINIPTYYEKIRQIPSNNNSTVDMLMEESTTDESEWMNGQLLQKDVKNNKLKFSNEYIDIPTHYEVISDNSTVNKLNVESTTNEADWMTGQLQLKGVTNDTMKFSKKYIDIPTHKLIKVASSSENTTMDQLEEETSADEEEWMTGQLQQKDVTNDTMKSSNKYIPTYEKMRQSYNSDNITIDYPSFEFKKENTSNGDEWLTDKLYNRKM